MSSPRSLIIATSKSLGETRPYRSLVNKLKSADPRKTKVVSFVAIFAVIGTIFLIASHAATSTTYASLNADGGNLCGNASVVGDGQASDGSAVKFGSTSGSSCGYSCSSTSTSSSGGVPVVSGCMNQGGILSASDGTAWSNDPQAYTFQWEDCSSSGTSCSPISGVANVTSYTIEPGDAGHTIEVAVTGYGGNGNTTLNSSPTTLVPTGAPANSVVPVVSGSAIVGDTLSTTTGSWSNGPAYTYQWNDCLIDGGACMPISGATSSTYVVAAGDEGFTIEATVTGTNSNGSQSVSSAQTSTVPANPTNIDVSIAGSAVLGEQLTAYSHWSGSSLSYTYQWQDCNSSGSSCSNISGATASTYTIVSSDETHTIKVTVGASNSGSTASATSAQTATIQTPVPGSGAPANTAAPIISGTAAQGDTLTTTVGTWNNSPTSYTYQWNDCNSSGTSCQTVSATQESACQTNPGNSSGGTCTTDSSDGKSSVYVPTFSDVGHTLEVAVTASKGSLNSTVSSAPTAAITNTGSAPGGVTIKGDQLVNDAGAVISPHGAIRSGNEYACWQFDAESDGPIDAASVAAMASWNINFVRIQLNEDCWLNINGVDSNVSGANYITTIQNFVHTLHQYGIYAYISLMQGTPGSEPQNNNEPNAPDEDHSPLYWQELAATFKNDPNVIIAPQSETTVSWNCYINGCDNEATNGSPAEYGPFDGDPICYQPSYNYLTNRGPYCYYYYKTAPISQAVAIIRAAGFNGPISVPCIQYANECADYGYESDAGSWLSEVPSLDPDHQIMAETHIYVGESYCDNDTPISGETLGCFDATLLPILQAGYPIMDAETGDFGICDSTGGSEILPWLEQNGAGWMSYAWDDFSGQCATLLQDQGSQTPSYYTPLPNTSGSPAATYAPYVQSFDQSLPGSTGP